MAKSNPYTIKKGVYYDRFKRNHNIKIMGRPL